MRIARLYRTGELMKIKSELVNGDWERIYINGELAMENHSITARQLMQLLLSYGVQVEYTEVREDE
jgi:hypothetical protein